MAKKIDITHSRNRFTPNFDAFESRTLPSGAFAGNLARIEQPNHRTLLVRKYDGSNSRQIRNIIYLSDAAAQQKLDLYLPSTPAPNSGYPVVMAIHGGGWYRYSKEQFGPVVEPLTKDGFAVVAVNYQLSLTNVPSWPKAFDDLRQAVGWIHQKADYYQLNSAKVAAIGTSAGGNLAMMLATNPGSALTTDPIKKNRSSSVGQISFNIQAAVSFFGPTDLTSCAKDSRMGAGRAIARYLGGSSSDLPAIYQAASPLSYVSKTTAPIMMIHGTDDNIVPVDQSEKMDQALSKAGVMHQFIEVSGGTHSLMGKNLSYMGRSYKPEVLSFLKQAMKL